MTLCPACGEPNPARASFCLACGTPLPSPEEAVRPARKTVTVVFTDVAESGGLGERLDPESLSLVMAGWFDHMRALFERHGARVQKFVGDAVVAVFGIPAVNEDDALRAVRAAAADAAAAALELYLAKGNRPGAARARAVAAATRQATSARAADA